MSGYSREFFQITEVQHLLRYITEQGTFSLHTIKRGISKYMRKHCNTTSEAQYEIDKPDGLSVHDMYNPLLFQPGSFALHPQAHTLLPSQMRAYHCRSCTVCGAAGQVLDSCYFAQMMLCITHGWHAPCDYSAIAPVYRTSGNYPSVARYAVSAAKEFQDMLDNQVLLPVSRPPKILNPLGAILKNSDKMRAKVLVGIDVVDQDSLTRASAALVARGHPKIKCRLTTDLTATGINRASYAPPFRYPSLGDALRVVRRNGYIASGDVSRYFHSFPLAIDGRYYWCVEYGGTVYSYARCCFGHAACPYYASTWSAEFRQWALALGLDPAFMVDDWFLCETELAQARASMQRLCTMFEECGFAMSVDKFQFGQQIVFIGVLIDTVSMTIRFDSTQARGMRLQLLAYLERIRTGHHLDHSTIRHVCGKLNWYAEIVQSGRLHIRAWWEYERHRADIYTGTLVQLVQDTQWWVDLLQTWEDQRAGTVEYKILSAEELQNNPRGMFVLQSDASGTDGFGYYAGYVHDKDLQYVSKQWEPPLSPDATSHMFELRVLEDFLLHGCDVRDAVLVWISDNEGATWSINKGRTHEPAAHPVLRNILHQCDRYHLQIVALWVPRERNELADYLSHLAYYLNRSEVRGSVADLFAQGADSH